MSLTNRELMMPRNFRFDNIERADDKRMQQWLDELCRELEEYLRSLTDANIEVHEQNTDDYLDYGGSNQVSASEVKTAVTNVATNTANIATNTTNITTLLGVMHTQNTDTQLDSGVVEVDSDNCVEMQNGAYFTSEYNNGSCNSTTNINWKLGNKQVITLADSIELTFTAPNGACNLILRVVQDGTGSRSITWPGNVKWYAAAAPSLTTAGDSEDIVSLYYNGTNYYAVMSNNFG